MTPLSAEDLALAAAGLFVVVLLAGLVGLFLFAPSDVERVRSREPKQ